jgi:hypothetical protein
MKRRELIGFIVAVIASPPSAIAQEDTEPGIGILSDETTKLAVQTLESFAQSPKPPLDRHRGVTAPMPKGTAECARRIRQDLQQAANDRLSADAAPSER